MKREIRGFTKKLSLVSGVLVLLISCLSVSCEKDATVYIDGNVPPTFRMTGSGDLVFFSVSEIAKENQTLAPAQRDSRKDTPIWEIRPDSRSATTRRIDQLPAIVYGVVPEGFAQSRPETGSPPALIDGKVYEAGGPANNANGGFVWFTVRNGKSVKVPEPQQ